MAAHTIQYGHKQRNISVLPRRCFSSSSKRLGSNKPYLIVVPEKESPHAVLEDFQKVLDVRIEQLLKESAKHAETGRFHSVPATHQRDLSIESKKKRTKQTQLKSKSSSQSVQSVTMVTQLPENIVDKETKPSKQSAEQKLASKIEKRTTKSKRKSDNSTPVKVKEGVALKEKDKTDSKTKIENVNVEKRTSRAPKSKRKSDESIHIKNKEGATLKENDQTFSNTENVKMEKRTSSATKLKQRSVESTHIKTTDAATSKGSDKTSSKTKSVIVKKRIKTKQGHSDTKDSDKTAKTTTLSSSAKNDRTKAISELQTSKHIKASKTVANTDKITLEKDDKTSAAESSKLSKLEKRSIKVQDKKALPTLSKPVVKGKPTVQPKMVKPVVKGKTTGKPTVKPKMDKPRFYIFKDKSLYLEPFLEACVFANLTQRAISELKIFKAHMTIDVDVYNMLLMGLAQKGALGTIRTLFNIMSASGIKPNAQSYAYVLQCIGRLRTYNHELIASCFTDMALHEITVDDLFLQSSFCNDDREILLDVIHSAKPKYNPPRPERRQRVYNKLVQDLYEDEAEVSDGMLEREDPHTQGSLGCLGLCSKEELHEKFKQQIAMEIEENIEVMSIEEEGELEPHVVEKRKLLRHHRELWKMKLVQAIKEEKLSYKRKVTHTRSFMNLYYPFLCILSEEELADLLLLKVFDTLAASTEGMSTISLARLLGDLVYRKFAIRNKIKRGYPEKLEQMYDAVFDYHMDPDMMQRYKPREYWQQLEDETVDGPSLDYQAKPWKGVSASILGMSLADLLLRELRLDMGINSPSSTDRKLIPAFYSVYLFKNSRSTTYIKPHPLLVEMIEAAKEPGLIFESTILPMVVPPLPWKTANFGGCLLAETKIARCPEGSEQDLQLQDKSKVHEWYPVMDSLNQLSAVPWIVNKPVLDVIISVFKNGGSKALNIPQPACALQQPPSITSETNKATTAQLYRDRSAFQKIRGEMHSLRMTELYKLSIANKFRDEVFWFPHNMDFRGRTYPCPPHFNHLGNDVSRGILLFAKGRPLGERGLDWLKIHLVNLTGFLKRSSMQERLQYAEDHMELILDSADNPLEGKKWWQGADKQWESLACCMEIANATRSVNPSDYVSHFPVHQDGSCNGLQHYAALGRDTSGAQQVNLHPFDVPQDVYIGVAELVEEKRARDAAAGLEIAQLLEGHVQRKVVKQTVMTIVYGVTTYGAKLQILKQLREKQGLDSTQKTTAAKYLAAAVFDGLQQMFTKTREIQHWLTETARYISKAGHCVDWVTPLGFPVTQPYVKTPVVVVGAEGKSFRGLEDQKFVKMQIDTNKQRNGCAPNFIHSLDSTHMMLTSLYSQQAGITYVSVHDCYWTHASTVEIMNKICREQFVKLHKQPILKDLSEFLLDKYGDIPAPKTLKSNMKSHKALITIGDVIKQVPESGDFDLDNVLESTYFFS